jgi:predicted membrane protein
MAWEDERIERERERILRRHQDRMDRFQERMDRHRERWEARAERRQFHHRHSGVGGIVVGAILAGIGVLFLLENLGIFEFESIWDFWPAILIVMGISRASTAYAWGGRILGGIIAMIGSILLLENLHFLPQHFLGRFWPLILVALGIGILARNIERQYYRGRVPGAGGLGPNPTGTAGGSAAGSVNSPYINEWAVFGGIRRRVESQEFEGGEISAVFGGVEMDLRKAAAKLDRIVIDVNAIFGGIEIYVPETWEVAVTGTPIFGGFEDKTLHAKAAEGEKRTTLMLAGAAIFGGITVKN